MGRPANVSCRVIAFVNFKGGVGKTANVVNIAACLAATHEKRVLVVDLDAQSNSSLWLLSKDAWRQHTHGLRNSTYQLFKDRVIGTHLFNFDHATIRGVPMSANGDRLIGSLHLLPAVVELLEIEQLLSTKAAQGAHQYLLQALKSKRDAYDFILIDCPPHFFWTTKNAVFFADHLAIPYVPDFLSLSGFQQLAKLVEGFGQQVGGNMTALGRARISAIIVNRYEKIGNVFQQAMVELEALTAKLKGEGLIHQKTTVLSPSIRKCVKVAEAPRVHLPVLLHAQGSIGETDYSALSRSFLDHFEGIA
ncbi:MAG: ParA family protein [bacterium]